MVRPMVHSTKHYVQVSVSNVGVGAKVDEPIATAVESTVANLNDEVIEGATIKAVYVEMWVQGTSGTTNFILIVAKMPSGLGTPSFTNMTALFNYKNKKNILYTTQGLASNDGIAGPVNVLRGWIKIPKSKQRMGLGDSLNLVIATQGAGTLNYCGFFTYKEYT